MSVLDCDETCPAPVLTDAAGWFTVPALGLDSVRLRFEPPACSEDDLECEPLEPREELLANGARTALGANRLFSPAALRWVERGRNMG